MATSIEDLSQRVSAAFADRTKLKDADTVAAVRETLALLDAGELRVAEKGPEGWRVNAWVKEAILLFFAVSEMRVMEVGPFEFYDKVPLKKGLEAAGVRVVPPGTVRYGAFVEKGAVVMPGYVNIGARVGAGNVVLTASTQIIDVTGPEERVYKGRVPARSVVIPGMREKEFPAGKYMVPCALIIGQRKASTDQKTSLNAALREFAVPV
ncbi:MAG: 2,3,4,5-tetrahydropyridine-2,6-dicarboxylate N-succinyltransferase [Myxococcaceae bacterium]|nr:MAG: 2,3,4,5-tetrahydropyridine-2,6-dicarboxylate N-succinyltransferase [Myxococcaceae bacterium]